MNPLTPFTLDSSDYTIKRLSHKQSDLLQVLYEDCTDFAQLSDGQPPLPTAALEEFEALPPGKNLDDKFIFGLFDPSDRLIGVLESVRHYPDDETWWVGLLMLAPNYRQKGLGAQFYKVFETWVATQGNPRISLSVIEANEAGLQFWKQMGFDVLRKTAPRQSGTKTHRFVVMSRYINRTDLEQNESLDHWQAIAQYLDESGCVTTWPSKRNRKAQRLILQYLISKFDANLFYTEKEINQLLNQHHRFQDPALLRREMFEAGILNRKLDGSVYWIPFDG